MSGFHIGAGFHIQEIFKGPPYKKKKKNAIDGRLLGSPLGGATLKSKPLGQILYIRRF